MKIKKKMTELEFQKHTSKMVNKLCKDKKRVKCKVYHKSAFRSKTESEG